MNQRSLPPDTDTDTDAGVHAETHADVTVEAATEAGCVTRSGNSVSLSARHRSGSPHFGRLLLVLISAVFIITLVTIVSQAYYS